MAICMMDIQDVDSELVVAQHGPFVLLVAGVVATKHATFEEWQAATVWVQTVEKASPFWIGDLLAYGEASYGQKYSQAIEATGHAVSYLMNIASVASKIPPEQRHPELSFSHHQEVAALPEAERTQWLDKAELEDWSSKDLRRHLQTTKAQEAGQSLLLGIWIKCADEQDQEKLADELKAAGRIVKLTSKPLG